MSKSLVIAVAFAGLLPVGPAIAADLSYQATPPPVPAINWTGFYVGAHAGPGWSLSEQTFTGGNLTMLNDTVMSGSLYYKVFNVFNPFV